MVVLLHGGTSAEREVSLLTSASIAASLDSQKIPFIKVDPKDSDWLSQIKSCQPDIVIIALHGPFGEDGQIQKILEDNKIKYTGSNSFTSALSINKNLTKQKISSQLGVKVPPNYEQKSAKFPVVVKPNKQGSSFGISIIDRPDDLPEAIKLASKYDDNGEYIIEKLIVGRELTCAVVDVFNKVEPLPLVEIIPTRSFFDYDSKYSTESGCLEICPAVVSPEITMDIQQKSVQIFKQLKIKQYCRIDWILQGNVPYFIEINTLPGMTPTSLINKELAAADYSFDYFISRLIETA